MSQKSSHNLVLAVRDMLAVVGALYVGITTYEHVVDTEVIHPTGDDYIMFAVITLVVFLWRQLTGGAFRRKPSSAP